MKAAPRRRAKVYELHRAIWWMKKWHATGGMTGTLYQTLASGQAAIEGSVWTKRERQQAWTTDRCDLLIERKIRP